MNQPALKVVPDAGIEIEPKYLNQITDPDVRLSDIFVYCEGQAYLADQNTTAFDYSGKPDGKRPLPSLDDRNLINLGGTFSKADIEAARSSMRPDENPIITTLRETIRQAINEKSSGVTEGRISSKTAKKSGLIDDYGVPIGVLAFET